MSKQAKSLSEFQTDLWLRLSMTLGVKSEIRPIEFRDGSLGLHYIHDNFSFWIYDDEAMFQLKEESFFFEKPDFKDDETLKRAFLESISKLL